MALHAAINISPYDSGMVIEDVWPTIFFGAVERLRR